jgi:FixJ family two-component response regulator
MVHFLGKPFTHDELMSKLAQAIDRRRTRRSFEAEAVEQLSRYDQRSGGDAGRASG